MTTGSGYIFAKSLSELKALTIRDGNILYEGVTIPTLDDVLDLAEDYMGKSGNHDLTVNIEQKSMPLFQGPEAASLLAEKTNYAIQRRLRRGWRYKNFLVSSFNHNPLGQIQQLTPGVRLGALITENPVAKARYVEPLRAYSLNPCVEYVDRALVDDAHARGMKVFVWTVNTLDDLRDMMLLGADGVFTNYPTQFRQYLDSLRAPAPISR